MKCCAVIDTNVLISALLSKKQNAATVQVLELIFAGDITMLYSKKVFKEYKQVLHRKKFGFSKQTIKILLEFIQKYGIKVNPKQPNLSLPDMDDVPFYEIVLETKSNGSYLVTGNIKHFPKEPFIVTARELITILKSNYLH